jgi:histidine triad (HIT) family protein
MPIGVDFDPQCAFCRIVRGQVSVTTVWEDEQAMAFFPLSPAVAGHTLVVPKTHVSDYWAAELGVVRHLAWAVHLIGRGIQVALRPDGMNLITSAGDAASQSVYHLHLHVVPRWQDDRIGNIWPPDRELAPNLEHDLADRIRGRIDDLARESSHQD